MTALPPAATRRGALALVLALVAMGLAWGLSQPLSKILRSEGHAVLGIMAWQNLISAGLLWGICVLRGRMPRITRRRLWLWLFLSLSGSVLPNAASYVAVGHLPAGVVAIVIASVPLFALPMALALGNDRLSAARALGVLFGIGGVVLIALPEAALPAGSEALFIPLALLAPLLYAVEGNVIARWGMQGLDAVQALAGASTISALITWPLALGTGQGMSVAPPWDAGHVALPILAVSSALIYAGYVWLVGRAGAVFAAQISYFVTGGGVLWSMALLGERYSLWIWAALALMLSGVALVRPREPEPDVRPSEGAIP
ncbi:DMT family transporter [Pseudoroseicyclus aestuarii]|uniref:Drug/metabolite transporter (DMT)-like permease n=1 Tax=Pseudoroseicyclus aestuarii TaxID=1795041 RepID=A0A318T5H0_9RHOB|nr:DMT family transporter [Pseudoroseicyclus aestuarii]PYE82541.1 drug/metabolite transporter (DMT)-like permease [Pseudoroseicyclus aestuarii]